MKKAGRRLLISLYFRLLVAGGLFKGRVVRLVLYLLLLGSAALAETAVINIALNGETKPVGRICGILCVTAQREWLSLG